MQCSEKRKMNEEDLQSLQKLSVSEPDGDYYRSAKRILDSIAKPVDSLGEFEDVIARIAAIREKTDVSIDRRALVIMSSDNGIVDEGVSQSGREVTLKVVKNILNGRSSAGVMAKKSLVDCFVTDVGIDTDEQPAGLICRKIRRGSRDFLKERAMTGPETKEALLTGINTVYEMSLQGYELLALGEMGIGNTTTSSAICAALLKLDAGQVTGRGAGLTDQGLERKKQVIGEAIQKYDLYNADAFTVLQSVGGYDIAALAGMCIGGAIYHIPMVLDGVITQAAALVACRMIPGVRKYLFASHKSREKSSSLILDELGLHPVIDAGMALGEGTGALMFISLLDHAFCVYHNAAEFHDLQMNQYERYHK